ncbi:hypothetical protein AAK706_03180 [Erysipelotrichaceae bacterium 66-17]
MASRNEILTVREIARCAVLGALFYIVFHLFSNVLYVEGITLTLFVCAQVFKRKEVLAGTMVFAMLQLLFHGFMIWNMAYAVIFPLYALWFCSLKKTAEKHEWIAWAAGALAAFLLGQLVDLPFLVFGKTVTIVYILLGMKTSLIQAGVVFLEFLFLYEPMVRIMKKIAKHR